MASKGAKAESSATSKIEPKKALFDDSSSEDDQEDGGATLNLKVNEEYARRFEHNKKREELHRLQEKYGANGEDEDSESSTDESEDDEAVLITEDLDAEISATLAAIKNKDPRIYDKDAVFYKPFDPEAVEKPKEKKEKPMFLRDYHRERYMAGDVGAEEDAPADPQVPRTYNQEQDDLKKAIISEINAAAAADDEEEWSDDDAFIKPAQKEEAPAATSNGVHPSRAAHVELSELDVKNADKNPEEFLSKFMASKAWAPEANKWQAFESDDEDDDDMADQFEHAYNMRFEDPTKSNEILTTYSRNMAAARSARKEELTGRKKLRALEKEKKEAEKKKREEERARLRRLKIDEASEKLAKIKQAAGASGKKLTDEEWLKFLDDAWENDKWEEEMKKYFDDSYYAEADEDMANEKTDEEEDEDDEDGDGEDKKDKKNKKPKKPKWDDDIDITDLVPDFEEKVLPPVTLSDEDVADAGAKGESASDSEDSDSDRPAKKRKTAKDTKKEKIEAKRQARAERAKIESLIDQKMELENPRALSSSSKTVATFRYRETSPNSFGLTARDILLAPSDAALNEFAGLKKLATFRDAEKKKKDKKKLGKKARLRQWRRETFGRRYEESGPTFGFEKLLGEDKKGSKKQEGSGANAAPIKNHKKKEEDEEDKKKGGGGGGGGEGGGKHAKEKKGEAINGIVEGERKKKRKRSKNKSGGDNSKDEQTVAAFADAMED